MNPKIGPKILSEQPKHSPRTCGQPTKTVETQGNRIYLRRPPVKLEKGFPKVIPKIGLNTKKGVRRGTIVEHCLFKVCEPSEELQNMQKLIRKTFEEVSRI